MSEKYTNFTGRLNSKSVSSVETLTAIVFVEWRLSHRIYLKIYLISFIWREIFSNSADNAFRIQGHSEISGDTFKLQFALHRLKN